MSNKDLLDNIKKLREMTGVGFKDCKTALDETKGDRKICRVSRKRNSKSFEKMGRTVGGFTKLKKKWS